MRMVYENKVRGEQRRTVLPTTLPEVSAGRQPPVRARFCPVPPALLLPGLVFAPVSLWPNPAWLHAELRGRFHHSIHGWGAAFCCAVSLLWVALAGVCELHRYRNVF